MQQERVYIIHIGFGNMGETFLRSLMAAEGKKIHQLTIVENNKERLAQAEQYKRKSRKLPIHIAEELSAELFPPQGRVYLVLAVKPQTFPSLADSLQELILNVQSPSLCVVSMMAGVKIENIEAALACPKAYFIRIMPSLSVEVQKAALGISYQQFQQKDSPQQSQYEQYKQELRSMLDSIAVTVEIEEEAMPLLTAMSGSGIAFALGFINALAQAGLRGGMNIEQAVRIASIVTEGAAALLQKRAQSPHQLIDSIASPGGTTVEGMYVLEKAGFTASVMDAVEASYFRAHELEGNDDCCCQHGSCCNDKENACCEEDKK